MRYFIYFLLLFEVVTLFNKPTALAQNEAAGFDAQLERYADAATTFTEGALTDLNEDDHALTPTAEALTATIRYMQGWAEGIDEKGLLSENDLKDGVLRALNAATKASLLSGSITLLLADLRTTEQLPERVSPLDAYQALTDTTEGKMDFFVTLTNDLDFENEMWKILIAILTAKDWLTLN